MTTMNKSMFRFIHATDLHYEIGFNRHVPKANLRIACLIEDIKRIHAKEPLMFVLFTGDLTEKGSACKKELSGAKDILDTLPVPYYVIAGNHDLAPNRTIAAAYPGKEDYHEGPVSTSNYSEIFGMERTRFSFRAADYLFAGVSLRDHDPDGMIDWLEKEICGRTKVVLAAHYGLYPARDSGPLNKWGFARIGSLIQRLRSIVKNENNGVLLYLYGHNHVNSVIENGGIYHVSSGGIQKGCTGYRVFSCYEDSIKAEYRLLSDAALHDFNYWGGDSPEMCVDSTHTGIKEYHIGNNSEQSFTVNLDSLK